MGLFWPLSWKSWYWGEGIHAELGRFASLWHLLLSSLFSSPLAFPCFSFSPVYTVSCACRLTGRPWAAHECDGLATLHYCATRRHARGRHRAAPQSTRPRGQGHAWRVLPSHRSGLPRPCEVFGAGRSCATLGSGACFSTGSGRRYRLVQPALFPGVGWPWVLVLQYVSV